MIKINQNGRQKIKAWLFENAKNIITSDANIDHWCQMAETSYIDPVNKATIELPERDSKCGNWLVLELNRDCYENE